jgi:D-alanyl-D-alanine carboxypeptidase
MLVKFFLIILIFSFPFWWFVNNIEKKLEDFFFWSEVAKNPNLMSSLVNAQFEEKIEKLKPIRKKEVKDLEIEAKSALSILINEENKERILFKKEENLKLPIASLTKLMTALVVVRHYDLSKEITVSSSGKGEKRNFFNGRTFKTEYFLYPLLIESNNEAAIILSNDYEGMKEENFISLMNEEAKKIGLENTFFANPTGLDPEEPNEQINYSTALDLVKLTREVLKEPFLLEVISYPRYLSFGPELINTNKLFFDPDMVWRERIIGGKTGYTEKAGGVLLLILKAPKDKGTIINLVLGTENSEARFREMKKLVKWLKEAYYW